MKNINEAFAEWWDTKMTDSTRAGQDKVLAFAIFVAGTNYGIDMMTDYQTKAANSPAAVAARG